MTELREKHPRAIRWFHWVNFPILALMIWSGLLIYWANDVYRPFFPDWVYMTFHLHHRLAEGMGWHFFLMWIFAINGVAYVAYTLISGEWRYLVPTRHSWKEAWLVFLHDLHLKKTAPPQTKFNAAQRISYTGIVIMGGLSLITGLAIYKPVQAQLAHSVTWRLRSRTARAFHLDAGLRRILSDSRRASRSSGMENFPQHDLRLRGASNNRNPRA